MKLFYIHFDRHWTDGQWTGDFSIRTQSRGEIRKNPLCKFVFECVNHCQISGVDENHLRFVTVHLHSNPLGLLLHRQLAARRRLSPERVSVAQANYPEALSGVEEDGALPFDGLLGHSDVPVFALAHVYGPAVLPRYKTGGSQHTHTAGAAFRVVGKQLLAAVLHTAQLFRER